MKYVLLGFLTIVAFLFGGLYLILDSIENKFEKPRGAVEFPVETEPPRPIPKELPTPPLDLPKPSAMPATYSDRDLTKIDADDLERLARLAIRKDDHKMALAAQYWVVEKSGEGQYDLCCYYALNGKLEESFYWLQRAAREEGVDDQHVLRDSDLDTLRTDPRFEQVLNFLKDCNRYWKNSKHQTTLLYLPKGYDKTKPTALLILLHGFGSKPKDFFGDEFTQELADQMKIPLLSVSGSRPMGPKTFQWAESAELDTQRIEAALQEMKEKSNLAPNQLITLGFSQGAQVALDIAVRDPKKYAGAIAISPGADFHLNQVAKSPEHATQRFVVTVGKEEPFGNQRLAEQDKSWLTEAKAKVDFYSYPERGHQLPERFDEVLPQWVDSILKHRRSK